MECPEGSEGRAAEPARGAAPVGLGGVWRARKLEPSEPFKPSYGVLGGVGGELPSPPGGQSHKPRLRFFIFLRTPPGGPFGPLSSPPLPPRRSSLLRPSLRAHPASGDGVSPVEPVGPKPRPDSLHTLSLLESRGVVLESGGLPSGPVS